MMTMARWRKAAEQMTRFQEFRRVSQYQRKPQPFLLRFAAHDIVGQQAYF